MRTLLIPILAALTAFGQETDWSRLPLSVRIGERVRVESAQGKTSGELVEMTGEEVVVLSDGQRSAFPASDVKRIYWLPGKSHNVYKWVVIGYLAGAASGAVTGAVLTRNDTDYTGLAVVFLGGLGGLVGAIIGFVARRATTAKKLIYQHR